MRRIGVIITARGGSKGLPGKNTRLLNGKPLIDYSIEIALNLSNVKAIAVSSDSDEILKRGSHYGVTTIRRPKSLAEDYSLVNFVKAIKNETNLIFLFTSVFDKSMEHIQKGMKYDTFHQTDY